MDLPAYKTLNDLDIECLRQENERLKAINEAYRRWVQTRLLEREELDLAEWMSCFPDLVRYVAPLRGADPPG